VGPDKQPVQMTQEFVNSVIGNAIPPNYFAAIEKGYQDCIEKGPLIGHPIERVRMVVLDGNTHPVDSSEYAFRICTHFAFRQGFFHGNPGLLEPIMDVEVITPTEFQSAVVSLINKRRGTITNSGMDAALVTIHAEVPLAFMFGYSTDLRSVTEGEFAMEYKQHSLVPQDRLQAIVEEYKKKNEQETRREQKDKK